MWGIVVGWELTVDVHMSFKVGESLVETICLHMVFNAQQGLVFSLNFGHNGLLVDFQLSLLLVVLAVVFHFCVCSGVFEAMRCFSQGVVGPSSSLE